MASPEHNHKYYTFPYKVMCPPRWPLCFLLISWGINATLPLDLNITAMADKMSAVMFSVTDVRPSTYVNWKADPWSRM